MLNRNSKVYIFEVNQSESQNTTDSSWSISLSTELIPDNKVSFIWCCTYTHQNPFIITQSICLYSCNILCSLSENEDPNCVSGLCFGGCDQCSTNSKRCSTCQRWQDDQVMCCVHWSVSYMLKQCHNYLYSLCTSSFVDISCNHLMKWDYKMSF